MYRIVQIGNLFYIQKVSKNRWKFWKSEDIKWNKNWGKYGYEPCGRVSTSQDWTNDFKDAKDGHKTIDSAKKRLQEIINYHSPIKYKIIFSTFEDDVKIKVDSKVYELTKKMAIAHNEKEFEKEEYYFKELMKIQGIDESL